MIGEKRRTVVSSSLSKDTSESPLITTLATGRKHVSWAGKENVPPLSITDKGNGGVREIFHQTDGESYPPSQTQNNNHSLSRFDSEWIDTSVSNGLDELDSEILESSGLAELDDEILETFYVNDLDSGILGSSVSSGKSPCEQDHKKLKCGSYGVGSRESRSIESRLLSSRSARNRDEQADNSSGIDEEDADVDFDDDEGDFESTQFDVLMKLCEGEDEFGCHEPGPKLSCPLCGIDISEMNEESRQFHANECIDKSFASKETSSVDMIKQSPESSHSPIVQCSTKPAAETPLTKWLQGLGLAKYETAFIQQEIDLESLQWLTEKISDLNLESVQLHEAKNRLGVDAEVNPDNVVHHLKQISLITLDLITMGISALGPRKKILQSIPDLQKKESNSTEQRNVGSEHRTDAPKNMSTNKLITDFFSNPFSHKKKSLTTSEQQPAGKLKADSRQRQVMARKTVNVKRKDVPSWCTVPGTPFRVDAFRYLRRDCSHWFLTHFHIDHYQGLAKSFSYGKIYCSMITARLINTKIGISWDKLEVMPLNQKLNIAGVDVTCYDANHCPGAIMLLFEPPNGEPVLHTGDFRFNEDMSTSSDLQRCHIHTLILDTTYCNPQYNFPKQEEVMQFVIEAIQAESFNPKTLFLIGSYTMGKERLFLEVARVLQRKIYVPVAKLRLLECLGLPAEDMRWFTRNENESNIHVVPMWTIASFKRLKQLSYQYTGRFSLIVAFSPTGWSIGKGKKSAGRKRQQGTIIRYEVPYSEHSSFEELKEFVKLLSPVKIIPSVNNEGEVSSNAMTELLLS